MTSARYNLYPFNSGNSGNETLGPDDYSDMRYADYYQQYPEVDLVLDQPVDSDPISISPFYNDVDIPTRFQPGE